MFGGTKVKVDKDLFERAKRFANLVGYSTVDEFVAHLLERELSQIDESASEEEIKKRLQGLGYIS
jgi:hypothetical protein